MKSHADALRDIERRLTRTWHLTLGGDPRHWPHAFPLSSPSGRTLDQDFPAVQAWSLEWIDWARGHGLELQFTARRTAGTKQTLPTHLVVPDVDTAARVAEGEWRQRLVRGRARLTRLRTGFPDLAAPEALLRATDGYNDVDFDLLCVAAAWFKTHEGSGLSPRQVPIEGLHSKWLNTHRQHVLALSCVPDLGLVEVRPIPVHFTYLDPNHRQGGGRLHDSVSPGYAMQPAYFPDVVVITENKDSAVLFPEWPNAVSVQGHGSAGPSLISRVDWLTHAARVIYWGDLDARGFEIVNEYRRMGVSIDTILMDATTLARFARFQAYTDDKGVPLRRSARKNLPLLTDTERLPYEMVTDPSDAHPIRVEQERMPLTLAADALDRLLVKQVDRSAHEPSTTEDSGPSSDSYS